MISKNSVGLIVMILSLLGAEVSEADLTVAISVIGQIASLGLMFWHQVQRRDVKGFFFKE